MTRNRRKQSLNGMAERARQHAHSLKREAEAQEPAIEALADCGKLKEANRARLTVRRNLRSAAELLKSADSLEAKARVFQPETTHDQCIA
ncbi:hypothetical protein [Roseibium sp. RKSG952]|uniref:hypothetical protein n=1 Tax=Roseibium sp. RKSG952 TaxID=2529384 RepID=UPI0012BC4647|nr:hypothetical protein [Roseibium sp. RKSG952]MTH95102.1 hypothetical protein [Roseibium sp. RKSG952]